LADNQFVEYSNLIGELWTYYPCNSSVRLARLFISSMKWVKKLTGEDRGDQVPPPAAAPAVPPDLYVQPGPYPISPGLPPQYPNSPGPIYPDPTPAYVDPNQVYVTPNQVYADPQPQFQPAEFVPYGQNPTPPNRYQPDLPAGTSVPPYYADLFHPNGVPDFGRFEGRYGFATCCMFPSACEINNDSKTVRRLVSLDKGLDPGERDLAMQMLDRLEWMRWLPYNWILWPFVIAVAFGVVFIALGITGDHGAFVVLGGVVLGLLAVYLMVILLVYCCMAMTTGALLVAEEQLLHIGR
jgi:hypothetical protein